MFAMRVDVVVRDIVERVWLIPTQSRFSRLERGNSRTLCSKNDVVNLTLSRREFSGCWQRASNVGSVQGVFAGRVNQHDIAVSNCFGVLRIVQHGGIEARSHDGSIRWVLASALSPLVLHKRGNLPLGHSGLRGAHCSQMRSYGSIGRLANTLDLPRVFDRAQRR